LVITKREEHLTSINKVDDQNQFEIAVNKWKNISKAVMKVGCLKQHRNNLAYKDKMV
jgi:hypothetical protein